uniref:Thrombospondin-type laminin G domain and EAR repeats a n=1 Tax=Paramormyrops kingsleyae TaxID=1676925 RepID=A0A3B3S923_9TELE
MLPLDLLSRALPTAGGALQGLCIVQDQGTRGLRLLAPAGHRALSFPASQLFVNCDLFPAEFSIVVTLKRGEYIFSLVEEELDLLLLGLQVGQEKLQLLVQDGSGQRRITVRGVPLADGRWHTLVLSVTGRHATVTMDCDTLFEPFPVALRTTGSMFYIGSRRALRGLFSGLLRQLVLLPGLDAASRICPASDPRLAVLSVTPALLEIPVIPLGDEALTHPHAGARLTQGSRPPCAESKQAQLWFDTVDNGLFLCDGLTWVDMLQEREKLDYLEDHQDLHTLSETLDIELFHVPSLGLFAAMANWESSFGSRIYKWTDGKFQLYQNISTSEALAWKFFTVDDKMFLAAAISKERDQGGRELSVIYKWSPQRLQFLLYQSLETHSARDWEAFHIGGEVFLAVANLRQNNNHNIDSVIYKWNPSTEAFEVNQTIQTSGAYDWEFFTVGPYHFLVVANTFNGVSTHIESMIYIWLGGIFQPFQAIMQTLGATDWEMFRIGSRVFLAVANSQKLCQEGPSVYALNSTIYELDMTMKMFLRFQDIGTYAVDWEFFTVGDEKFLVVANSFNGQFHSLNSVIYWQGYEGFVPVHRLPTIGCKDWEFFKSTEDSYLIYSSATEPLSKVLRLKTF